MKPMKVSRAVNAPASVVWEILTDIGGAADTFSAIDSIEIHSDRKDFGVGLEWRETRTMFGRQATEEMRVTAVTPGESYVVEADPGGANYRTVMSVTKTGEGTSTVSMEFGASPQGLVTRLMGATVGRLFARATRKALEQDLAEIAAAAEARA